MRPRTLLLLIFICAGITPAFSQDNPAELVQARTAFERDSEFALRPIRDRYLSKLDALKRSMGARGDARGAVAIQDEIDRVVASAPAAGGSKFTGVWTIRYENGTVRKYSINGDDMVTLVEENDKPVTKRHAKIVASGNDMVLDLGEGKIERLRVSNNVLTVEHFSPKSTYPGGVPLTRGAGTKSVSK